MLTASHAATAPAPAVRTFTLDELGQRSDALALRLGTRATATALLLACVIVILVGAQAMLAEMESMDRDIKAMNEQMAISNAGLEVLNTTMDVLPATSAHVAEIVKTVRDTGRQVQVSSRSIGAMATTTEGLDGRIGAIAGSTSDMRTSLEGASKGTDRLGSVITELNTGIAPLVKTQHDMYLGTRRMRSGLDSMNSSLAYVVRQLNYMTAPPTGGGLMMRADLAKNTLPPLPGLKATVDPLQVFDRNIWPIYSGH